LLGVSGRTHAQEAAPATPAPAAEAAPPAEEAAAPPEDEDSIVPPSPARAGPPLDKVKQAIQQVDDERNSTTNFWPWLAVGIGLGASVGSAAYGAIYAIDCDHNCSSPNWASLTVVAGAAVAALSMIWLVRTNDEIRELNS